MAARHDYHNWLDRQTKRPEAEEAFMAGYEAGAKARQVDEVAAPGLTAQEYAAQYTMGRAPYAQGERGADY